MNKDRRLRRKIGAAVIATILVVAMVIGLIPNQTAQVIAADKTADLSTVTKYTESLGDNASTEYAGRVWTDKTVYSDSKVEVEGYGGVKMEVENDSDFLVGFSALATSQSISGEQQAPMDVMFIIDLSGSMSNEDSNMTNSAGVRKSRIAFTVDAVNKAIEDLMKMNPNTRVGVVGFSRQATTLLELDHYTKSNNQAYFSLSTTTGNRNNATLYTRAVNSAGNTVTRNTSVSLGTNIQDGLYDGMNLLATEEDTTVTINGKEVQRVPAVVLLSDGAPTWAMSGNTSNWWSPSGYGLGDGSDPYAGVGMLAMMTGAYMKGRIDANYGVTNSNLETTLYTVGVGIDQLDNNSEALARVTLNPGEYYNSTNNTYASTIRGYWEQYCRTSGDNTPRIQTDGDEYYELTHPSANDISGDALAQYVDQHYEADDADSIATVFKDIVSDIAISTPMVPTEHDSLNPTSSGYITYTDPIGEYMEVKDMKAILYAGHKYEAHTVTTNGNVTTYTFTETAEGNAVYGSHALSNIIIQVESTDKGDGIVQQTMTIKIPAALIPLRVNTVQLSGSEETGYTVKSHTNNGTYPIRVFYTVGLQDAVIDGDIVATHKLDTDYVKANSNTDGTINFFSNLYTGQTSPYDENITIGDATVVFDADSSNPFYYMQENAYIYEDEALTIPATASSLEDGKTYYYKETHYHGTTIEVESLARTGAQLKGNTTVLQDETTGQWYRPAGTVRVNRMLLFEGEKVANATNTADDFYTPTYNSDTGHFVVYLGNNGVMSATAGGSLAISKTVDAAEGLTAPTDKEFTFTVDLDGATGTYVYEVTNAANEQISTGTISDGGTIKLKDGETATILNLPPDTKYTVTETPEAGFHATSTGSTGTIATGTTSEADFTNTYTVTPVQFPSNGHLTGTKVLEGRTWNEGVDTYTFLLTPYNNAPLPADYNAETGVTVTKATNNQAVFDFGVIEFTKPGTYRYTIVEKEPENDAYLPGISYSRALYRVVVEVVDNGDGTLTATSDIQKLYTDDAQPLFTYVNNEIVMNEGQEAQDAIEFTNTYNADSVVRVPVAVKTYTDNSGENPLVSGMFEFKLEAIGENAEDAPMPSETVTTNEGGNVTFPGVTFTQEHVLDDVSTTYTYKMTEILPEEANASNNYTVNGMKYDPSEVIIEVTVSIDATSHLLNVNAVYPNGERTAHFVNEYTPVPVTIGEGTDIPVEGTKTLTGRDMKDGESFDFAITAADDATSQAITDKVITMPANTTESVSGGKDGKAVAFAFDQITFAKPGVYTFNISEVIPETKAGGVTYDEHVCTVTVTVTDNDGKLEAAVVYDNGTGAADNTKAVFANTYTATFDESTAISLSGTKNMTGRPIEDGEFFFEVTLDNGARATYVPSTSDDTANEKGVYEGTIEFLNNMTYTEAGEYVYYIKEVIPSPKRGGVEYDETIYKVTVTVTDNLNGKLSAAITEIAKSTDGTNYTELQENENILFNNVYTTTPEAIALLDITKVINGTRGTALREGEFTFEVSLVSGDETGVTLPSATRVTNDADGKVVFGEITFSKVGTYVIQAKEVVTDDATKNEDGTYTKNGITYSTNVIQSTFEVTDNLDGTLTVTRTGTVGSREFVNTYNTTGTLVGSTELVVTKVFTGRDDDAWADGDVFSFVLDAGDEKTTTAIADGKIVLPSNADGITVDKADADKKVAFGDIVFYEAGTYTFIVREEAGEIPGVDYDATARIVTVTATDNSDGTLTVTASGNETADLTFNNTYNPDDVLLYGHGNLHVTKEFTGREDNEWLDTDSFTFTLAIDESDVDTKAAYDAGNIVMASTQLTINHDNKDHAHFGNITFKQTGTFQFVVKEVEGNIAGVKYDETAKTIIVNVTDNNDGTMSVAIDADSDALTFSNSYEPTSANLDGETNLKITKEITGRTWTADDEFKFLLEVGDTFTETNAVISQSELTVKNQGTNMTVVGGYTVETYFGDITLKEAGVYRFRILEKNPENTANMAYDRHSTVVIVTVDHNYDEGKLEVTDVTYVGSMTWTNEHIPNSINVTLTGTKELVGRTLTASDKFNFSIEAAEGSEENIPMPSVISLQNLMSEISFGPFTYTTAGTYKYIIRESGYIAGVTNDGGYVIATVTVTDNNGVLSAETSYEKMNASNESDGNEFKFVNIYSSVGTLEGRTNLKVTKNFTGRANDAWLDSDEFTFTLAVDATHADTVNAEKDGSITMPTTLTLMVDKDNKDDAYFGDITFTKAGTYQFTVTETEGTVAGVTYDKAPRTVIVNVIDQGDGTMLVVPTTGSATLTFTNTYKADSVPATLAGLKKMSGRDLMSTDIFEFTISGKDNAPLPAEKIVKNAADGKIQFAPITYEEAGTYVYEIAETGGSAAGVTDTTNKVTATVTVEDKNVGKLEVTSIVYSVQEGNGFAYTNTYTTTETDGVTIDGFKVVSPTEGNSYTMVGGEFTFEIAPATTNPGNDPISTKQVTNAQDGSIIFAEGVTYKQEGDYVYTVREIAGNKTQIGYDSTTYTVTVTVRDDKADAKLKATVTIAKGMESVDDIQFDNKYTPGVATTFFSGKKVLDSEHIELSANKFQFKLEAIGTNAATTPMPEAGEELVYNDASGGFQFGTITYKSAGEYTYQISEVDSGEKGYTYDDAKYTVTVKVTDENGTLQAAVTGLKNADNSDKVVFTNGYVPDSVTLEGETALVGKKILKGRKMNAEEFKFQLIDKDNQVVAEATNDAEGNFKLGPVKFTKAGTYYYTIAEVDTKLGGVTYDDTVYTVKVDATDKGGYLVADVTYLKDGEKADVVFENIYKAQAVGIQISAAKNLTGRELKAGEFTFLLKNEAGEIVAKATNDVNGLIVFEEIKYDKAGTYEYTISEEKGNAAHVTYDDSVYEVTVTAEDQLDGTMKVNVDYAGVNPVFTNNYNKPAAPQTGDFTTILPMSMMVILAAGLIAVSLKKRYEVK